MKQMEVTISETPKPAPPPAPATPPAPKSPDEIKEATKHMFTSLWGEDAAKTLDEPSAPPGTPPTDPAATTPPATPPAAPEPEPEPLTADDLISRTAEATGKAVADAMARHQAPPTPPAPPAPELQVRKADERDYNALAFLAEAHPDKWGKQFGEYSEYLQKLYAYEDKWETDHPGEEFNEDDEEHQAFYDKNEPAITEADLEDARIQMKAEQLYNERMGPIEKENKKQKAFAKNAPAMGERISKLLHGLVEKVDPSLAALMVADGKIVISEEVAAKVAAKDPIAAEILQEVIQSEYYPMIREMELASIPELEHEIDPSQNAIHAEIDSYRREKESQLRTLPAEQRVRDGKQWLSVEDHIRQRAAIHKSSRTKADKQAALDELERRVWSLSYDDLQDLMIDKISKNTKSRIEKENARAEKKFGKAPQASGATQPPPPPAAPAPPPAAPATSGKPRPPSISSPSEMVTTPNSGQPSSKSASDQAVEIMFGR